MADSFDANNPPKSSETLPSVPPSSSEVAIRTMASDLEAMGKSGGLAGMDMGRLEAVPAAQEPEVLMSPTGVELPSPVAQASRGPRWFIMLMWAIVILLGGALFLGIGYYLPGLLGR